MLELVLSRDLQDIIHSSRYVNSIRNFPYRIRLVEYTDEFGYHELNKAITVLNGDYFTDLALPPDFATQQLYDSISSNEEKGVMVFGSQFASMCFKKPEIIHALLLTLGSNTLDNESEFKELVDKAQQFIAAIKFLSDVEIIRNTLPVTINNIYFIVSAGSLENELLNSRAEIISNFTAPNDISFNIYRLWKQSL